MAGLTPVSGGHSIYWERSGKAGGVPAVFLHGGPGSGCTPTHRRYFDPDIFDLTLFDQRGSGRSTPKAGLDANTTSDLIADIESLREMAGHERWIVAGPSWGSTLAIAYAEAHPERVSGLLVEGVYLATRSETDWWHSEDGAPRFHPDAWADFIAPVPEGFRATAKQVRDWYLDAMRREAEGGAPILDRLGDASADIDDLRRSALYRWTEYEERLSWLACSADTARTSMAARGKDYVVSHSLIEAHYFANDCFLAEGQLLANADRLASIPMEIIQSRQDMVCPPRAAWHLAQACPQARLTMIAGNGHAMTEAVYPALIAALSRLA
ncbi:prolyl aminopeptidase [Hyphobacterium marinum]|uniref:Proline iminopeptidase n=1 Tax=Hyphobacterium marinum TaxID=3116574 RepID=A0ABU7M010_9PROT|nr:prolyl aminopeptidase [Hyphobacterium sp. Y6023]MEE2567110.1 prolyl aminopeptidase [Hyphobacterium sp. Y6023]